MAKYKILHTPFYYLTIVSQAILLFFGALLFSSALLTVQLPRIFAENIQLLAEASEGATEEEVGFIASYLREHRSVISESVEIVTSDEALRIMEDAMGSDLLLADMTNPFMDVVKFRMVGESNQGSEMEDIRKSLIAQFPVAEVYIPREATGNAGVLIRELSGYLIVGFIGLLILVFILIHQIMRMNIVSNRFMIRTMEIVGASKKFIMRPFVREALKIGAIAAVVACAIYFVLLFSLIRKYGEIAFGSIALHAVYVLIFTALLSLIVSLMSTSMAVSRQLGRGFDEA